MDRLSHLPAKFHIVLQWENNISERFGAQNAFLFIKSKMTVLIRGSESDQLANIVKALNAVLSPADSDSLHCNYSCSGRDSVGNVDVMAGKLTSNICWAAIKKDTWLPAWTAPIKRHLLPGLTTRPWETLRWCSLLIFLLAAVFCMLFTKYYISDETGQM